MKKLFLSITLLSTVALAACGDDGGPAMPGDVEIRTQTQGSSLDPDGYSLVLDLSRQRPIGINDVVVMEQVEPGQHIVELGGLARNCSVASPNPVAFELWGGVVVVPFDVRCSAAGALAITSVTDGIDIDTNGYGIAVDGVLSFAMRANESVVIAGLAERPHEIELTGVAGNCSIAAENPRTVDIVMDDTVETLFEISCAPALLGYLTFTSERDGDREIYAVTQSGSERVNMTNDPGADFAAAVSPDGTRIAFTTNRDGNNEIYVMNHDLTGLVNLTNNAASDEEPAWSPDGSMIAFVSDRDGNAEIYVMNADGTGVERQTRVDRPDRWPTWSPEGDRLAFSSWRDGNWEIYVMDLGGLNQTNLTMNTANDRMPDWSPTGDLIAFVSDRDGNSEIYSLDLDTGDLTNITTDPGVDLTPAWSPDGTRIAFATDRDGDLEIYVLTLVFPALTKLTDDGRPDYDPSWSPLP